MNIEEVRKMTKGEYGKNYILNLPPQRVTVRCADCRWYSENVLIAESSKVYAGHRERRHAAP